MKMEIENNYSFEYFTDSCIAVKFFQKLDPIIDSIGRNRLTI